MRVTRPVAERFWEKVQKTRGCWLWVAGIHKTGYGLINVKGVAAKAHRIAWTLANGPIPDEMHVLHRCDIRRCVRVDHLYLGTNLDNVRDTWARTRPNRAGTANGRAKVTMDTVLAIRKDYDGGGVTKAALARTYGIGESQVRRIVNREHWVS